ncbi:MAG: hypothetical protein ACTS6G_00445 [Candidatus Hodgkinia cicadicola]
MQTSGIASLVNLTNGSRPRLVSSFCEAIPSIDQLPSSEGELNQFVKFLSFECY